MENNANQNAQTQGDQQPTQPTTPTQTPQTPPMQTQPQVTQQPAVTPEAPTLTDEQSNTLKESITKDLEGRVGEQVSKSVIQKIGEALGLTKKQEEALPTDAQQLQKLIDDKVKEKFDTLAQQAEQEEQLSEQQRSERVNTIIGGWYTQYNQLAKSGKVPTIKNSNDENDVGVQARKKIIIAIGKMVDENKKQGVEYVPSVSDVLLSNPEVLSALPGADLPISGNTQAQENNASFSHQEVRTKSFEELARG